MNIKQQKEIREYHKDFLDYKTSMSRKESEFNTFMYNYNKEIEYKSEEWYRLATTFYHAWNLADRYFRNADAADMLDVRDSMIETINQLRKKRNETRFPQSYMAYANAINIMKEALSKIPKRIIRI